MKKYLYVHVKMYYFETSWDYLSDPLVALSDKSNIALSVDNYIELLLSNFTLLKKNEEKLNQIFAKIYGLQDTTITDISENICYNFAI